MSIDVKRLAKPISALFIAVMLCGLTGCAKEESSVPSFEIELIGQTVCLPCKVKDIYGIEIDTKYTFGSYQRDDGKYISFAYYYYNDKRARQIYLEDATTVAMMFLTITSNRKGVLFSF